MTTQKKTISTDGIAPVPPEELDDANARQDTDPGWQQMEAAEMEYICRWRKKRENNPDQPAKQPAPDNLTGLALSGGGIRSATFSLGVMQAFAHHGVLKRMDYLSTVSGGGYIGSAVSWLVSDAARKGSTACGEDRSATGIPDTGLGLDADKFPYGTDDPAPNTNPKHPEEEPQDKPFQQHLLRYLSTHGYYMTPGNGVTAFSLLGTILRGTLLNLLVWIPIFTLFFLVGLWASDRAAYSENNWLFDSPPAESDIRTSAELWPEKLCWWGNSVCVLPHLLDALPQPEQEPGVETGSGQSSTAIDPITAVRASLGKLLGFELVLYIGLAIFALLLLLLLLYSFMTWLRPRGSAEVACRWYQRRRLVERVTAIAIPSGIAMLVIGTLPVVGVWLHGWMVAGGPIAVIVGAGMTIQNFFSTGLKGKGAPAGLMVSIGAGLLLYGVFLVAYEIAYLVFTQPGKPIDGAGFALTISLGLVWVVLLGWCVDLNHISIHRYYRDRLMECFMPDIDAALANQTGRAVGADSTALQDVANPKAPNGPYHIVNTTAILVNSKVRTYSQRGGDSFILSPLYCGSNATGWKPTENFMSGDMTLATAMAISGAAVNPNSGVGGEGVTRNKTLSLVMSLLNLRLSYWARNPSPATKWLGSVKLATLGRQFKLRPNHLFPGAYSFGNAIGMESGGFSEKRDFVQISDGGQFEDLGVYELIRRRVGLIIACDGGQDGDFTFSDLQVAVQRVWTDFRARITVNPNVTPDQMIPMCDKQNPVYPMKRGFADRGFMVCKIAYNDGSTGTLLFLKTTLIRDVSFRVKGYAAQNPDFPDQTTADQFFDEVQFEAYRELGYRIATQMLAAQVPANELEPGGSDDDATPSAPTQTLEALIKSR